VELRQDPAPAARARKRRSGGAAAAVALEDPADQAVFEALRARRMELAREQGVPPYVVFSDRSLLEMAARRPETLGELHGIHGVGEMKLARYGETFLEVLRTHAAGPGDAVPRS